MGLEAASRGATTVAERRADRVVDAALGWLETAPERFFLWVHIYDPHADYRPPEPFASRFRKEPYLGEIAFADAQVGRLLDALDARFGAGGTLVVVTADHGESEGEHGEPTHSYSLYDATQHVPLWLAGPGIPAGGSVDEVVRLADVAPTLLELAGAPPLAGADGESLVPLLRSGGGPPRTAYLETLATQLDLEWSPLFGVRTARHKYLRAPRPELYDLAADPKEQHNLADAEPALRAELDALLDARMAGRTPAPPNYVPDATSREHLESLGYVVPVARAPDGLGRVGGPDPKDHLPDLAAVNEVNTLLGDERAEEALAVLAKLPQATFQIELLRALARIGTGDLAGARESGRRAVAAAPGRSTGYVILAHVAELQGDREEAEAALQLAERAEPDSSVVAVARGRLAEASGRLDEAERHYRRGKDARTPAPEALWRLAAFAIERGEFGEADALLAPLPAYELRRSDAAARLGAAELRAGRAELGLLRVDAGLREHPDSTKLLLARAMLLEDAGRLDEALAVRERLLALHPEDLGARNALAWTLGRLGRQLERALALARGVVAETKGDPGAVDTLATILLASREPHAALEAADGALPRATGESRALLLYRRAEALAALGDVAAARSAFAQARASGAERSRALDEAAARVTRRLRSAER
jgi:tetratricopeptide (TPR) repeat protein